MFARLEKHDSGPMLLNPLAIRKSSHYFTCFDQLKQLVGASEADHDLAFAAVFSAAFPAQAGWWPEAPSSETTWIILAMLVTALIAAGAAIFAARWAARSTMKNARELQDRERRHKEKSVAALLSADLHRKLVTLVQLLPEPNDSKVKNLATMDMSTKVLEAALPKLGVLDHQGTANLLAAFDGIALLVSDAREDRQQDLTERMRVVALHIGCVLNTLWGLYELDRPKPLDKAGMKLEEVGLKELKDLGL